MNLVPLKVKLLPPILFAAIKNIELTARVEKVNEPPDDGQPKIFATWHGRQYSFLRINPMNKLNVLVSKSNDGEIITRVLKMYGFSVIRGSASRGGMTAVRHMREAMEQGGNIAFTVDGPRGPRYEVKKGVIKLAQQSGAPIIPLIAATKDRIIIKSSWDHYNVPYYFTKVKCFYGEPFSVPEDADDDIIEIKRLELQRIMRKLTYEADQQMKCSEKDYIELLDKD